MRQLCEGGVGAAAGAASTASGSLAPSALTFTTTERELATLEVGMTKPRA
jgi:hypothetical protein